MCGITGHLLFDTRNTLDNRGYYAAHQQLRHRGPDDEGFIGLASDGGIIPYRGDDTINSLSSLPLLAEEKKPLRMLIGHRRLSIIDLSPQGHQPMGISNAGVWVVFNGEIYNYIEVRKELQTLGHAFQSQSDTEVLLRAYLQWGSAFVEKLDGMWAFALYDHNRHQILLSRDRAGMKPLYYYQDHGQLVFGSEMKFIRAQVDLRKVNPRAVSLYLYDCLVEPDTGTFFESIHQLPAGHLLVVDTLSGSCQSRPYWDPLRLMAEGDGNNPSDAVQLLETLSRSVDIHLRSDVPLGVALSGGVDSSAIACLIQERFPERVRPLHTFSVTYDQAAFSEEPLISETLQKFSGPHVWVRPSPEAFREQFGDFLRSQEIPVRSLSVYAQYSLMRDVARSGVKVILGGQGSDELFGGYSYHSAFAVAELCRRGYFLDALREIRDTQANRLTLAADSAKILARRWFPHMRLKCIPTIFNSLDVKNMPGNPAHVQLQDWLSKILFADFRCRALPEYLHYEDRNSMAHSVESRLPFLGKDVMELAFQLPLRHRIHHGVRKSLLREALRGIVPAPILDDRVKKGFICPQSAWLRGALKPTFDAVFLSGDLSHIDSLNAQRVKHFYQAFQSGEHHNDSLLWRLFCFIAWTREMV